MTKREEKLFFYFKSKNNGDLVDIFDIQKNTGYKASTINTYVRKKLFPFLKKSNGETVLIFEKKIFYSEIQSLADFESHMSQKIRRF